MAQGHHLYQLAPTCHSKAHAFQKLQPCEKLVFVACNAACLKSCIWMLQRLVAHAEEVAYNDPPSGAAEQLILNQHLYRLLRHNKLSAFQRFVQQVYAVPLLGVCFCSRAVLAMALCLIDSFELVSKFRTCCVSENAVGHKQALATVIVCQVLCECGGPAGVRSAHLFEGASTAGQPR